MTSFPGSPRTLRAALVSVDLVTRAQTVIAFQYNPHTLTRSVASKGAEAGPSAFDLAGPPTETITLEAELDAADALAASDPTALKSGLHSRLAAIERLLYPSASDAADAIALADQGSLEVLPPQGPLVLFVWGARRVLPVSIRQLSITEEAFDPSLNPIRARVSLTLKVLTWQDFGSGTPAHALSAAWHSALEALAASASSPGLDAVLGGATLRV